MAAARGPPAGTIKSGALAPGDRLPSIVSLAQEFDLAPVTVRKAITRLRDEGLVESRVGWGTFVAVGSTQ